MSQFFSPSQNTSSSEPLKIKDLVSYFEQGSKSKSQLRIGLEHEKIGIFLQPDGSFIPLPYQSQTETADLVRLLSQLSSLGWQPIWENENLIALRRDNSSVTLEPGGQLELSGAPQVSAEDAIQELNRHLSELLPLAQSQNIFFLSCGFHPFGKLDHLPRVPKKRYQVMRQYLPSKGKLSLNMMHQTATVQANLDYENEEDAQRKFRLSLALSPLVTSLFAASPLKEGKPNGYQSFRAACWLETDNARCGIPTFAFQSNSLFQNYTKWALDIPMFFIYRNETYHSVENFTFRQFLDQGWQGQSATLTDWDLHLSTLFPDTRLRTYLEMRSADSGPLFLVHALPYFWESILYSQDAYLAAWDFVKTWSYDEVVSLRNTVPQSGMNTTWRGKKLSVFCKELLQIAKHGATTLQGQNKNNYLEPLIQIAEENRSFSDEILSWFENGDPNPSAFFSWLTLKS